MVMMTCHETLLVAYDMTRHDRIIMNHVHSMS